MESNCAAAVEASGGKVLGAVRHPLNTADFSSFLLQAQASGADVVAFANAGGDTNNSFKQAAEFGLGKKQRLAGLILNITNIPALGLAAVQNSTICTGFYWDMNDDTRAFAKRFQSAHPTKMMPNDMHAGMYSATAHLIKAMAVLKSAADGVKLVDQMKAMPTDDPLFGKGSIRIDGRKLHPMYLLATKTVEESKGDWDYFKVLATIKAEDAWRPLDQGGCPFVKI
jgi:branched-chain amino acid transport system substrate-binding protein